ncbi:ribokinase [Nocardioides alkalitolerans]|uniref:ribokinase n=1 Tax=Nocardioides alkalitolerans TaxID=281714 RepID=UPI00042A07C5|nr:ribokinase [Nocardioides alkalitolerans]
MEQAAPRPRPAAPGGGRVVVVGSLNVDTVQRLHHLPAPGETLTAQSSRRAHGGKGANQAVAARRAGASVTVVGCVGDDADGRDYVARLDDWGIGRAHVAVSADHPTGSAVILVDPSGENSIVVAPGSNGAVDAALVTSARAAIEAADVLLLQLEVPDAAVVAAARLARAAGVRVLLNPSPVPHDPSPALVAVLAEIDLLVVNEGEAGALGLDQADPRVCTTLGAAGARWGEASARPPTVDPVDTTGAGDTFAGTLAAGLAAGRTPEEALTAAVTAAATSTTWRGAQPSPS